MKTVYRNTRHPRLVKWSAIGAGVQGVVFFILYCLKSGEGSYFLLYIASYLCFYSILFRLSYLLLSYTVDPGDDSLTDNLNKKNRLRLSNIKTATINFMNIRTSQANAEKIIAQIREANPGLEIKHSTYF